MAAWVDRGSREGPIGLRVLRRQHPDCSVLSTPSRVCTDDVPLRPQGPLQDRQAPSGGQQRSWSSPHLSEPPRARMYWRRGPASPREVLTLDPHPSAL